MWQRQLQSSAVQMFLVFRTLAMQASPSETKDIELFGKW